MLLCNEAVSKTPPDRAWVILSLDIMTLPSQPVQQDPVIKQMLHDRSMGELIPRSMDRLSPGVRHHCVSRSKNLVPLQPEGVWPSQKDTTQVFLQAAHALPVLQTRLQPWTSPPLGVYFHLVWCHLILLLLPQTISIMGLVHSISAVMMRLEDEVG